MREMGRMAHISLISPTIPNSLPFSPIPSSTTNNLLK